MVRRSTVVALSDEELVTSIYEDYSMNTPFEKCVGRLSELLESWGLGTTPQSAAGGKKTVGFGASAETYAADGPRAVRATEVSLDGRPYRVAHFSDSAAPPWPLPLDAAEASSEDDFGPGTDWTCFLEPGRDGEARRALRALFGVREAVVISARGSAAAPADLGAPAASLALAARELVAPVKGGPLEAAAVAAADELTGKGDADDAAGEARCRTVLAAGALACAEAGVRLPVVVAERGGRGAVLLRGASAAFPAAADLDVAVEPAGGGVFAPGVVARLAARTGGGAEGATIAARYGWVADRRELPIWGGSVARVAWRSPEGDDDAAAARLLGGELGQRRSGYRRGEPLWGPKSSPVARVSLGAAWPPRRAGDVLDDPRAALSSFRALDAPAWRCAATFEADGDDGDDAAAPLGDAIARLAALYALAAAAPPESRFDGGLAARADVRLDDLELRADVRARARDLALRAGTLAPARLEALLSELFDAPRPAMDDDDDDDDDGGDGAPYRVGARDAAAAATTCGAGDLAALLALRLAGMTSFEAMAAVWSGALARLRDHWDRGAPLHLRPTSGGGEHREARAAAVFVGGARLDGAADVAASLSFGGPLQRHVAIVDASCRAARARDGGDDDDAPAPRVAGARLADGAPLSSPAVQLGAPAFGKASLEVAHLVAAGRGDDAAKRARQRDLARLASDAAAFKDANPGCAFADFWGWASPGSVDAGGSGDAVALEVAPADDAVVALWSAVKATPAAEAAALFDAEGEAETALHRLEVARPRWVAGQLLACGAATAVFALKHAAATLHGAAALPSVAARLDDVDAQASALAALVADASPLDAGDAADAPATLRAATRFADALDAAERHLARAVALLALLRRSGGDASAADARVAERALGAAAFAVDGAEDRGAVCRLLAALQDDDDDDGRGIDLPPPASKEYVLWHGGHDTPSRLYAAERAATTDGGPAAATWALAVTRAD